MDATEQAIDQTLRIVLSGAEYTLRLSGAGAERLAAALWSVATTRQKTRGKARLAALLKSQSELKVFSITETQLKDFAREARRYGVLYAVIKGTEGNPDALADVMVKAEDAAKINRIAERLAVAEFDESDVVAEVEREQDRDGQVTLGGPEMGPFDESVLALGGMGAPDRGVVPKDTDALLDEILTGTNREVAGQQNPTGAKTGSPAPSEPSSRKDGQPQNRTSAETDGRPRDQRAAEADRPPRGQDAAEADAAALDGGNASTERASKTRDGTGFGEGRGRESVRAKIAQKRRDRAGRSKDAEKPARTRSTGHQAPATRRRRKPKSKTVKGR
jgi:hypothetical protein